MDRASSTCTAPSVRCQYCRTLSSASRAAAEPRKRCTSLRASSRLRPTPRRKTIFRAWPVGQLNGNPDGAARIERRPYPSRKLRRKPSQRDCCSAAVAADEFGSVAGHAAVDGIGVEKGNPAGEFAVVRISRQQRSARGVDFGHDVHPVFARRSPSTHSTYPVAESWRGRPDSLRTFNTANLTDASSAT